MVGIPMYIISFFLAALVFGALYVITSSTMYDPPEADDNGGGSLQPMPPTFSGPTGSIRYRAESTEEMEDALT